VPPDFINPEFSQLSQADRQRCHDEAVDQDITARRVLQTVGCGYVRGAQPGRKNERTQKPRLGSEPRPARWRGGSAPRRPSPPSATSPRPRRPRVRGSPRRSPSSTRWRPPTASPSEVGWGVLSMRVCQRHTSSGA